MESSVGQKGVEGGKREAKIMTKKTSRNRAFGQSEW
jgi:hypothetical protein